MDEQLLAKVKAKIQAILPEIKQLRHQIHQAPEIGLATPGTRQTIAQALAGTGLTFQPPLMESDLIAELPGPVVKTICLRADTDALPVQETTQLDYASRHPGAMHACGHDGHTAILVGTALVLDSFREQLPVSVRFVFQPGEEVVGGGKTLVRLGACGAAVEAYALHNWPGIPVGQVATRPGPLFAAGVMFNILITGRGCHGAMPEQGHNPIPVAASLVTKLHELHREVNQRDGSVVSVCSVLAGDSQNIIPDTAVIRGTTRYLNTTSGLEIERALWQIVASTAAIEGITVTLDYPKIYDLPLINTELGVNRVAAVARQVLPAGQWQLQPNPQMVCEDFAFYLENHDGALFLLGAGIDWPRLHNPNFDFNDEILETGILMMSLLALDHPG